MLENLVLFIPFAVLRFRCFRKRLFGEKVKLLKVTWQSVKTVFLLSSAIEILQLLLRLGIFRLSDLFFNTMGEVIDGLIYWMGYQFTKSVENSGA